MWEKTAFYGVVAQAQDMVPGFKEGYRKFEQQVVLNGLSKGLLTNYGRNAAHLCLFSFPVLTFSFPVSTLYISIDNFYNMFIS